jgi:vacuolar-type H+-ATPase subunit E/Vma4
LKSANIDDAAAEQLVHAFEEHNQMAISEAMKFYDQRITAMQAILEAKLDAGFKSIDARFEALDARFEAVEARIAGVQAGTEGKFSGIEDKIKAMTTSVDGLKWYIIILGSLMTTAVAGGGVLTAYVQLIK